MLPTHSVEISAFFYHSDLRENAEVPKMPFSQFRGSYFGLIGRFQTSKSAKTHKNQNSMC